MRILFVGDVVGKAGREAIRTHLPGCISQWKVELAIVNGENAADQGFGITQSIYEELLAAGADAVTLGNTRGETTLTARIFDGLRRGVLIAESIQPNKAHIGGRGINTLTGATSIAPIGGAAFHDNKVWVKNAAASGT